MQRPKARAWNRQLSDAQMHALRAVSACLGLSRVGLVHSPPRRCADLKIRPSAHRPRRPSVLDQTQPVRERELSVLYVEAAWHGTGMAQALVESLIGEEPASLWVAEDNARAQRFYAKLGFAPDGARHVDPRWPALPDIRMVR